MDRKWGRVEDGDVGDEPGVDGSECGGTWGVDGGLRCASSKRRRDDA